MARTGRPIRTRTTTKPPPGGGVDRRAAELELATSQDHGQRATALALLKLTAALQATNAHLGSTVTEFNESVENLDLEVERFRLGQR
ncbi:hypothetical protein [Streptacidiphilus neutrinimicus]|uniref:hypothetical protein n=1 Tax=Streptacidiphilus neutrinimicus TaxID=105420 RepID=UPI0005A9D350|nr:hypothetical protein [Streptacidiphilus neutrinimicus]